MTYQLILHSLSALAPTPDELVAQAGISGLKVEVDQAESAVDVDSPEWTQLTLRAEGVDGPGFTVTVTEDLEASLAAMRQDKDDGHEIPDVVFGAQRLYVLELPGELGADEEEPAAEEEEELSEEAETRHAAFALTTWALAAMTDGIVFDPQEELFADADSFMGLLDGSIDPDGRDEAPEAEGEDA